jgi:hypothetical protein
MSSKRSIGGGVLVVGTGAAVIGGAVRMRGAVAGGVLDGAAAIGVVVIGNAASLG